MKWSLLVAAAAAMVLCACATADAWEPFPTRLRSMPAFDQAGLGEASLFFVQHVHYKGTKDFGAAPYRALVIECGTGDEVVSLLHEYVINGIAGDIYAIDTNQANLDVLAERIKLVKSRYVAGAYSYNEMTPVADAAMPKVVLIQGAYSVVNVASDGLFDLVLAPRTFEHLPAEEMAACLARIASLLADDGCTVLSLQEESVALNALRDMMDLVLAESGVNLDGYVALVRSVLAFLPTNHVVHSREYDLKRFDISTPSGIQENLARPHHAHTIREVTTRATEAGLSFDTMYPYWWYDAGVTLSGKMADQVADYTPVARAMLSSAVSPPRVHTMVMRRSTMPDKVQPPLSRSAVLGLLPWREQDVDVVDGAAGALARVVFHSADKNITCRPSTRIEAAILALIDNHSTLGDMHAFLASRVPGMSWDAFAREVTSVIQNCALSSRILVSATPLRTHLPSPLSRGAHAEKMAAATGLRNADQPEVPESEDLTPAEKMQGTRNRYGVLAAMAGAGPKTLERMGVSFPVYDMNAHTVSPDKPAIEVPQRVDL